MVAGGSIFCLATVVACGPALARDDASNDTTFPILPYPINVLHFMVHRHTFHSTLLHGAFGLFIVDRHIDHYLPYQFTFGQVHTADRHIDHYLLYQSIPSQVHHGHTNHTVH